MRRAPGRRRVGAKGETQRGQAVVEFTLIFTLFFLLVGVAVQGAFLFNGWLVVTNAAREGARAGAPCLGRPSGASPCTPDQIEALTKQAATGASQGGLVVTVICGPDPGDSGASQSNALTVQVQYHVPVLAPFVAQLVPVDGTGQIPVSAQSTMRLENQSGWETLSCATS